MTARTWHKGPPPFPGWWCATNHIYDDGTGVSLDFWRWWDGKQWFCDNPALGGCSPEQAAIFALAPYKAVFKLVWTDYWPENARVPRVDPRQPEQKPNYVCDRITLEYKAIVLLQEASRLGFNLTIENKPLKPLAMGHTMSAVCVWPKKRGAA